MFILSKLPKVLKLWTSFMDDSLQDEGFYGSLPMCNGVVPSDGRRILCFDIGYWYLLLRQSPLGLFVLYCGFG
jgi:hypothetical protein